jgi:hypothetical protein
MKILALLFTMAAPALVSAQDDVDATVQSFHDRISAQKTTPQQAPCCDQAGAPSADISYAPYLDCYKALLDVAPGVRWLVADNEVLIPFPDNPAKGFYLVTPNGASVEDLSASPGNAYFKAPSDGVKGLLGGAVYITYGASPDGQSGGGFSPSPAAGVAYVTVGGQKADASAAFAAELTKRLKGITCAASMSPDPVDSSGRCWQNARKAFPICQAVPDDGVKAAVAESEKNAPAQQ